jgi:DNA-binding transcriptional regulator/RsmH inhibitor MraZ
MLNRRQAQILHLLRMVEVVVYILIYRMVEVEADMAERYILLQQLQLRIYLYMLLQQLQLRIYLYILLQQLQLLIYLCQHMVEVEADMAERYILLQQLQLRIYLCQHMVEVEADMAERYILLQQLQLLIYHFQTIIHRLLRTLLHPISHLHTVAVHLCQCHLDLVEKNS